MIQDEGLSADLNHPCFKNLFHTYIFVCKMGEMSGDETLMEKNRAIVNLLIKGASRGQCLDLQEDMNGDTVAHKVCEMLTDAA